VLRDWINQIIGETEGLVKAKGLEFETRINESLPTEIIGDPDRLKQIVVNLISNAVKFTDEGRIEVELTHSEYQKLILRVRDTGIGIPSHMQETIFDGFRQVDGTSQRRYGGTGLGLAIVRNLCVMMDGIIRVESTVGKGSLFTVQLPLLAHGAYAESGPKQEVTDATGS
jgi:signal transduction histidine kinase